MGVTSGNLGIVADSEQQGSQRKPAASIQRGSRLYGEIVGAPRQVVRQQIQILMAKIHSGLDEVTSLVQRPVIAVAPHVLNLLERVAEGLLAECAEEIVAGGIELWQPEIDRRA